MRSPLFPEQIPRADVIHMQCSENGVFCDRDDHTLVQGRQSAIALTHQRMYSRKPDFWVTRVQSFWAPLTS